MVAAVALQTEFAKRIKGQRSKIDKTLEKKTEKPRGGAKYSTKKNNILLLLISVCQALHLQYIVRNIGLPEFYIT